MKLKRVDEDRLLRSLKIPKQTMPQRLKANWHHGILTSPTDPPTLCMASTTERPKDHNPAALPTLHIDRRNLIFIPYANDDTAWLIEYVQFL